MKHIQTLETRDMAKSLLNGGCGECQTSCQSACKTSCGIASPAIYIIQKGNWAVKAWFSPPAPRRRLRERTPPLPLPFQDITKRRKP